MALRYPYSQKSQHFKSGGSRRPSLRKMVADDSVVTEKAAEHLFHTTADVWRSTILYKHCGSITSPCLKNRNNGLPTNEGYHLPMTSAAHKGGPGGPDPTKALYIFSDLLLF
ncbi:hypothetical protein TNCV_2965831 [Trichonephila clavipes]|nr:hypothetical protein TNCV_2965831 [Trichonephila clavipes]